MKNLIRIEIFGSKRKSIFQHDAGVNENVASSGRKDKR